MSKLYNLARMTTATTGTGTITLGSAASGFLSFAGAGIADGDTVTYAISDGANSEIGRGTYTASGTTLTRSPIVSTNSNAAISLSGGAQVFITAAAEDFGWNNHRVSKTTNYTVTNANKNATIDFSGGYWIATFSAISGGNYDANFICRVYNSDSGHAKYVSIGSGTSFILYPLQTATIYNNNGAWVVGRPNRWILTANTTFYVDGGAGSDTANAADGLSNSSGARATVQGMLNDIANNMDLGGYTATVSIVSGTYAGATTITSAFEGNGVVKLSGDTTNTPPQVIFSNATPITLGSFTTMGAPPTLVVEGIKFTGTTAASITAGALLSIVGNMEYACSGVVLTAKRGGRINYSGTGFTNRISANFSTFLNMLNNGVAVFSGVAMTLVGSPTCTQFVNGVSCATANLSGMTFSGSPGTGKQWVMDSNSVLVLGGASVPWPLPERRPTAASRSDHEQ